jgi:hypothetical protein
LNASISAIVRAFDSGSSVLLLVVLAAACTVAEVVDAPTAIVSIEAIVDLKVLLDAAWGLRV